MSRSAEGIRGQMSLDTLLHFFTYTQAQISWVIRLFVFSLMNRTYSFPQWFYWLLLLLMLALATLFPTYLLALATLFPTYLLALAVFALFDNPSWREVFYHCDFNFHFLNDHRHWVLFHVPFGYFSVTFGEMSHFGFGACVYVCVLYMCVCVCVCMICFLCMSIWCVWVYMCCGSEGTHVVQYMCGTSDDTLECGSLTSTLLEKSHMLLLFRMTSVLFIPCFIFLVCLVVFFLCFEMIVTKWLKSKKYPCLPAPLHLWNLSYFPSQGDSEVALVPSCCRILF